MKLQHFIIGFLVIVLIGCGAALLVPWHPLIEGRITAWLKGQGYSNAHLKVSSFGWGGIVLEKISLGQEHVLNLDKITLGFSLPLLISGRVNDIQVSGLALDIRDDGKRWLISGMDAPSSQGVASDALTLPVTAESLVPLPFQSAVLEQSHLLVSIKAGELELPIELKFQKQPVPTLNLTSAGLSMRAQGLVFSSGEMSAGLILKAEDHAWTGTWNIKDIKITGLGKDVPLLQGKGTLKVEADTISLEGQMASSDATYATNIRLHYFLNQPKNSTLEILNAGLPWNGGGLSVQNVTIPFEKKDLHLNLKVARVSLNEVLKQLTGKETQATGAISGLLPVTLASDGTLRVEAGKLGAEAPGVIAMPPETIPGDNPQVALARDVLKNFQYSLLSIDVDQDKDSKLSVMMNVEGKNPDVAQGRSVKLNVHLTGDVLNFVQQNLLRLANPETLLQQAPDAQH